MDFVAIDVETANINSASICQIGIVKVEGGCLLEEWKSYVDPEEHFDDFNISIHGINESAVIEAPTFPELAKFLYSFLNHSIVVCHTFFDKMAIERAANKYGIDTPECIWLNSASIARRTWKECARKGYGLYDVCKMLGYEFRHHDALEDAKAAAYILLSAANQSGLNLENWLKRVKQPIDPQSTDPIRRDGNPKGGLFGECLVFTGALEMPRREAANMAAAIGCRVESGVTTNTTILVVGTQDPKKLVGHEKSNKQRKAEGLVAKGFPIQILTESDFIELVRFENKGFKEKEPATKRKVSKKTSKGINEKSSLWVQLTIDHDGKVWTQVKGEPAEYLGDIFESEDEG